ncbi:MAG TPA: adenylate/guanylate cyclase domain-containing protein [Candidatus Angelobacter sp.]|nr:adenylate/guanylate cyclase domain-containing protein [Candidatus Angelobacter sp.]
MAPAPARALDAPAAAAAAVAPVAERRLVSVLFVDLVGFTTLAEDRDPESTRELLTRYFDVARDAIERHGGTVEKFIGDAVMAVWGTPISHEDDSERCVRAALELVAAVPTLSPQLQARAGITTGEAAVTIGATNQGMVAGDLVNTAARLQGVAEPGTVLVGEATMRMASTAIVFEEIGEHSLKGKTAPVPAWRAVRVVAARGGQMRADALEPPFVGRDEELRLLKEQLHVTGRDQRARLVSIIGPGGIGKSRLVWEFEKYLDGLTETIRWHRGRSPSYGEGITFWALGEMVRRRAGLSEDDDHETTRARVAATVAEYVTDPDERTLVEPALLTLLGLETSPSGGRDALFPAWRIFFERISETGTTVLVFEDLQWADSGLLDFIDHLLDWSKSRPILVVTLARPELFERRPNWGAGRRALTALTLDPLTDDAIRTMLAGVVPGLPEGTVDAIVTRAEGMPLYAVETVRTLLAEGRIERDGDVYRPVGDLSQLSIPESLRSLIASRLDTLDPADRTLLQDASVLGQVFTASSLAALVGEPEADLDARLRGFVRRELLEIESDPRSPERGQYKFVQALIREVAYATLALRDRRSRHLAVARHYEAIGDDELAGALASHYVAAHESSAEGDEADAVAAQARIALRAAADRAAALGSHEQAISHIQRALTITSDSRERGELLERAATAALRGETGDADEFASAAEAAYDEAGDIAGVYRTIALRGHIRVDRADLEGAAEVLEAARSRPDWPPAPELEAEVMVALSRAYMRLNRVAECLAAADRTLEIAEPMNLERLVADALNNRAAALANLGRRRESTALLREAVALAKTGGWADLELRLLNNLAVSLVDDDPAASSRIAREMQAVAERIGSVQWYLITAAANASSDYTELRDWDGAIDLAMEARARAIPGSYTWIQIMTAELPLRAARGEEITALLEELERESAHETMPWWVDMTMSDVALAAGEYPEAARLARSALGSARIESNEPQVRAFLLYSLGAQGLAEEARHAADALRDGVFQGPLSKAFQAVGDAAALALEGRGVDARRRFAEGFDTFRRMEQGLDLARWEILAVAVLPDAPEVPNWAAEARQLLEPVGARAYLDRLDAVIPASLRPPAGQGARSAPEQVAEPS